MRYGKRGMRFLGAVTAAAMLLSTSTLFSGIEAHAETALYTDDLMTMQAYEVEESEVANAQMHLTQASVSADETDYDEDCYASSHGYDSLTSEQKTLYDGLKEAAHNYYVGDTSVGTKEYSGKTMEYFASVSLSSKNKLTLEDLETVIAMFRYDNPIYFFIGDNFVYSTRTRNGSTYISAVYLSCADAFTDSSVCQAERAVIETSIASAMDEIESNTTTLDCVTAAHDWINNRI